MDNLQLPNHLTCMFSDCGRKLENTEKTCADTVRTCRGAELNLWPTGCIASHTRHSVAQQSPWIDFKQSELVWTPSHAGPEPVANWSGHFLTRWKSSTVDQSVSDGPARTQSLTKVWPDSGSDLWATQNSALFSLSSCWREVTPYCCVPAALKPLGQSFQAASARPTAPNNTCIGQCYSVRGCIRSEWIPRGDPRKAGTLPVCSLLHCCLDPNTQRW